MTLSIESVEILLLVASAVSMLGIRLRLPYTVGLTLAGIALAFSPFTADIRLTRELIFSVFLPPLIFESALHMHWPELRADLSVVLVLATAGVLLSAALTAGGVHVFLGWPWPTALLLGVLISATDPVSVIATFKQVGVTGRLRLLVEAESLFNDGTTAVFFVVALAALGGGAPGPLGMAIDFLLTVAGGIVCGALVGGAILLLAGHTDDHLVEITFTTVAAYGSFLLAEHFHCSGVLATLTTGILLGNVGSLGSFSDKGREAVESFWEYLGFAANSLIFLMIGIHLAHRDFHDLVVPVVAAIALVTIGRALSVYGCCALFASSKRRVPLFQQHILVWGGLRGALALALVLGLPPQLPLREDIVTVVFGVVAFSVIVQGMTMGPLLKALAGAAFQENTRCASLPEDHNT